ncbi:hypothetical protein M2337_002677 [Sphingobium sp. B2D3A]|nr:hypothetical protein [Sphingobium sp. B2D3A]MCW2387695.1 hypothetical protein [Sphingobium sp. B11D3B]
MKRAVSFVTTISDEAVLAQGRPGAAFINPYRKAGDAKRGRADLCPQQRQRLLRDGGSDLVLDRDVQALECVVLRDEVPLKPLGDHGAYVEKFATLHRQRDKAA